MVETAPTRDYAGAVIIFSAAAVFASLIVLPGPDLLIVPAGISAGLSCHFLRPIARKLSAHQYFLRPFIMGCAVVLLSHLLFGLIAVPVSELWGLLTDERYSFEASKALSMAILLSSAGLFVWFITVPIGILAAYVAEVVGWVREDVCDRRHRAKAIASE